MYGSGNAHPLAQRAPQTMKHPHAFLISTAAALAAACTAAALSLAPVEGNRAATPAGFAFFGSMAAAAAALTIASAADAIASSNRAQQQPQRPQRRA